MNHPYIALAGLVAQSRPETLTEEGEPPSRALWMTYEITREDGAWRILFHGCKAGRFDSFDRALTFARHLARECAALGETACVALQRDAPPAKCEIYPARPAAMGGPRAA